MNNNNIIIPKIIRRRESIKDETVIPKIIIQTYKNNKIHTHIYNKIIKTLLKNKEYDYYFITDDVGIDLIKKHFDKSTLDAFEKIKLNAAKGDFIRYIALYIYGGIYVDLDASIEIDLNLFFSGELEELKRLNQKLGIKEIKNKEYIFFYNEDYDAKIEQWLMMTAPKNEIIKNVIIEMVKRINDGEKDIFLATGPTLFTDVIYNFFNNTNMYNIKSILNKKERMQFIKSLIIENGIFYNRQHLKESFNFRMPGYEDYLIYQDELKYVNGDSIFVSKEKPSAPEGLDRLGDLTQKDGVSGPASLGYIFCPNIIENYIENNLIDEKIKIDAEILLLISKEYDKIEKNIEKLGSVIGILLNEVLKTEAKDIKKDFDDKNAMNKSVYKKKEYIIKELYDCINVYK
jgi:hypothetical protein